jgi:phenylalanyl-tRNA synthetase beta chain
MRVSYKQLNSFFDEKLPGLDAVVNALTFHAWEIDGTETYDADGEAEDTILDVKILPDKSAWALSHRGIAKDLSVILNLPLTHDPLSNAPDLSSVSNKVKVSIETSTCTRYTASLITGVTIGSSPLWLVDFLKSIGQRSINNVVDITNYVMFNLGQPLHAFDAKKLLSSGEGYQITVRNAKEGETITTLTGETYTLSPEDTLIVDGGSDTPIGIAGIKGGKRAEVDAQTVDIILESANFKAVPTRKTSQRLKLRTDASARFENGVVKAMASYGLVEATKLIAEIAGGTVEGYVDVDTDEEKANVVTVSLIKINRVLGLALSQNEVEAILSRFGYQYNVADESFAVTAPFERPDLVIAEDLIEEIGRIYGYDHVVALPIEPIPLREINKRFYYAEKIREILFELGFSEVFTSSFRDSDQVKLANALASDKGYLRSVLYKNLHEAMGKNAGNVELFGTDKVRIFEIGTVFTSGGEKQNLALGVSSKAGVTGKDFKEVQAVLASLTEALSVSAVAHSAQQKEGVIEIDLEALVETLREPAAYAVHEKSAEVTYKPFSNYPHVVRDIAFWTGAETSEEDAQSIIEKNAGQLAIRIDCFDRFEKEGRVSYGFRIVFQSYEKTLTAEEVDAKVASVSSAISECGWVVR